MRVAIAAALLFVIAGAGTAQAQAAPRATLSLQPESKLWIEGTSSVRSYRCEAESMTGTIASSASPLSAARAGQDVASASLSVEVDRLECGNGTMNAHMKRALKQESNPRIDFRMAKVTVSGGKAWVEGSLNIAGQANPVTLYGDIIEEAGGALRLRGEYALNMTEFGVTPPRLMAGTMRVHDPVRISFDVVFRQ